MCEYLIVQEKQYREASMSVLDQFLDEAETEIRNGFDAMAVSIQNGESINDGLMVLGRAFGLELRFESLAAFKEHLESGQPLRL